MKKYIVVSRGGSTLDDSGNEVQNCQVIGLFYAPFPGAAIDLANDRIIELEHDFDIYELVAYELAPTEKI